MRIHIRIRNVLSAALLLMGICVVSRRAQAQQPDTMTLSVTPGGVTYSVQISSVNGNGYQFGTVSIGATTVSTSAITVNNTGGGNVNEFFGMKVVDNTDGWTPSGAGAGTDQFRLIGELAATQPAQGTGFAAGDAVTGAFPGAAATLYGQASTKTTVGSNKKLWLRLEMPTQLNAGTYGAQTMTLYIQGQAS